MSLPPRVTTKPVAEVIAFTSRVRTRLRVTQRLVLAPALELRLRNLNRHGLRSGLTHVFTVRLSSLSRSSLLATVQLERSFSWVPPGKAIVTMHIDLCTRRLSPPISGLQVGVYQRRRSPRSMVFAPALKRVRSHVVVTVGDGCVAASVRITRLVGCFPSLLLQQPHL